MDKRLHQWCRSVGMAFWAIAAVPPAAAAPDFAIRYRVGEVELVGDSERPFVAYVIPLPLVLLGSETAGEQAGAELFLTRYTGSAGHGDSGEHFVRSLLRFRITTPSHASDALDAARREMALRRNRPDLRLAALPIVRTEATLIARGVEGDFSELAEGFFEPVHRAETTVFTEREYIMPLTPLTAEAFAAAFERRGLVVSLAYKLWTEGLRADRSDHVSTPATPNEADEAKPVRLLALNDTLPVAVTSVKRVELDLGSPPDYPSLRVYCFDFTDNLRNDLFLKEVEFDAAGVAGGRTRYTVEFSRDAPAATVRSVRFPFAVDVAQPYRFRIAEVLLDGRKSEGEWQTRENWAAIIDITSTADRRRSHGGEIPPAPEDTDEPDPS
jgi:hypothetical protein